MARPALRADDKSHRRQPKPSGFRREVMRHPLEAVTITMG
jgi:hypothetical protein